LRLFKTNIKINTREQTKMSENNGSEDILS